MDNQTLNYYNTHADAFITNTVTSELQKIQELFLAMLPESAVILDFGCGSGRDTKCFLDAGHQVTAIDGSSEMCRLASAYTGIFVKEMLFQDLEEEDVYNGIWACSSILHLPYPELKEVLQKMAKALKENGIVYTSFKYGYFEGERSGRYFIDMTENRIAELIAATKIFTIEEEWITSDVRPERCEERWLNVILRKR